MRKIHRSIAITLVSAALALGITVRETPAFAQPVSDMDRAAARDLFRKGIELQNAGRFAEALDLFSRADSVVNAPTNMLHIAECHAALGHLVEALETYRALQRYPLPANPPGAFVQAVERGREEMKGVEPRVPELKVDVAPAHVPTLSVTIDDRPLNTALVGVSRPINPGVHKVVASAPGYTRAEQTIDIKEKERKAIALNLTSTGGVIYGPAGAGGSSSPYVTISPAQTQQGQGPVPDRPPPYEEKPRPPDLRSRTSIFIGPRLGVAIPTGNYVPDGGLSIDMDKIAKTGGALGVEAGIRFARIFYFSAVLEGAKYGEATFANVKYSASSFLFGGKFGILTNPDGFAFMGDIGIGYRKFSVDGTAGGRTESSDASSPEFLLGLGMHFKAGKILRLVPKLDVGAGSFGDDRVTSGGITSSTGDRSHAFVTIGLGGFFDIDLDKRSSVSNPAPPLPPTTKGQNFLAPRSF